jgi:hypothetical protein
VANVDRFLGGDWWHESFRTTPSECRKETKWRQLDHFLLKGSAQGTLTGIWFNRIAETEVTLASVGISIVVEQLLGFVNSNTFEFLRMMN